MYESEGVISEVKMAHHRQPLDENILNQMKDMPIQDSKGRRNGLQSNIIPPFGLSIPVAAIAPKSTDEVSSPCRLALLLAVEVDLQLNIRKLSCCLKKLWHSVVILQDCQADRV